MLNFSSSDKLMFNFQFYKVKGTDGKISLRGRGGGIMGYHTPPPETAYYYNVYCIQTNPQTSSDVFRNLSKGGIKNNFCMREGGLARVGAQNPMENHRFP